MNKTNIFWPVFVMDYFEIWRDCYVRNKEPAEFAQHVCSSISGKLYDFSTKDSRTYIREQFNPELTKHMALDDIPLFVSCSYPTDKREYWYHYNTIWHGEGKVLHTEDLENNEAPFFHRDFTIGWGYWKGRAFVPYRKNGPAVCKFIGVKKWFVEGNPVDNHGFSTRIGSVTFEWYEKKDSPWFRNDHQPHYVFSRNAQITVDGQLQHSVNSMHYMLNEKSFRLNLIFINKMAQKGIRYQTADIEKPFLQDQIDHMMLLNLIEESELTSDK